MTRSRRGVIATRVGVGAAAAALATTGYVLHTTGPPPDPGSGLTLAKIAPSEGFDFDEYAALEIAYDRASAAAMWEETVPAELPTVDTGSDRRAEVGVYGSLDDLDPDTEVLIRYSSGESGTCADSLEAVSTHSGTGRVTVTTSSGLPGGSCTADYNAYQVLAAVPRDAVPAAAEVGTASLDFDHPSLEPGPVTEFTAD